MPTSIGDRLNQARLRGLVGRADEFAVFRDAVEAAELPWSVLYVFGPGGVGKTTLLHAFAAFCRETQRTAVSLDARNIDATPEAFMEALGNALEADDAQRRVILVDTYEALEPLQEWVRDVFVPQLPANTLVVLAGRQPPPASWRADLGLQSMTRMVSLRNFSPEESRTYLHNRAVPVAQHQAALDFTHGHPLALSLVADVFAQRGDTRLGPDAPPDVIQALLERFVQKAPGPLHQAALEVCALAHLTTEALLEEMLSPPDARVLFDWLRGLSFVESGWRGLFPHDVAREALLADLRWRNPDRYADLRRRAQAYYTTRFDKTRGQEQQRLLFDYIFLHRDSAVVRMAFEWQEETAGMFADTFRPADRTPLIDMVTRHEGPESARLLTHWLERQPQRVHVFRQAGAPNAPSEPAGFLFQLALHEADDDDRNADPATRAAWAYLQRHAPPRPGEGVIHFRFWMARDTHHAVSTTQSLIFINVVRHALTTPNLAHTFFPCVNTDFWEPAFGYAEMQRMNAAEFDADGKHFGVFGNDWRALPPTAWLALLAEKEGADETPGAPPRSEPLMVLSKPTFTAAVRDALRGFPHPDTLANSPLVRSRVVVERAGASAAPRGKAGVLRALVQEAAESLQASPRQARGYRALLHTYLQPAPTQETAADRLELPFSTYRRHLMEGIAQVTEILWQQETGQTTK